MKKFKIYLEAKIFAIKRRLNILLFGNFDPYPKIYKNYKLYPSMIIKNYYKNTQPKLKIENFTNHLDWKNKSRKKLIELLKIKKNLYCKEIYNKNIKIKNGLSRSRKYIEFAKNRHAPIDILQNQIVIILKV